MIKKITLFLCIICFSQTFSQTVFKKFYSEILDKEREIKILLPRGYSNNDKKAYPVIYVLDADYLFEIVAGNVDYYSYWEEIPECIIVGVNQLEERDDDFVFSDQNSLPIDSGADFFEFFGGELVDFVDNTFKTEPFRAAVGHGLSANFINYYLLRDNLQFNAYITISPDFAKEVPFYIEEATKKLEQKVFYFMAVSNNDVPFIMEDTKKLHSKLNAVESTNFFYTFSEIDKVNHYTTPAHAIPRALDAIFFPFRPITKKEYETSILKLESSPVEYLTQKYDEIKTLFGIEKQIIINDFKAIESAIKKKEQWDYFEDLSKVARKQYPESLLASYYLGMHYEKTGKPKKAIKIYRDAYVLQEIGGITKEQLIDMADTLKEEFGE